MKNGVLRDSSGMTNETRAHPVCHTGSVSHNTFRSSFFTTFVTLEAFHTKLLHANIVYKFVTLEASLTLSE
jgi:hypothetical protein